MSKPRVLFAASEIYPFAKTGGLADVAFSLPRALSSHFEMDVVTPLYQSIDRAFFSIQPTGEVFEISVGDSSYRITLYSADFEGQKYLFIYEPQLCDREFLYGTPEAGYEDNALRFAIFDYALVALLEKMAYTLVHLNDWQTALTALLLQEHSKIKTKVVYTIHNLAYQGVFPKQELENLAIDKKYYTIEGIEFYDQISFMKAGIAYADHITTVSRQYAKEITTEAFGCGLEGFLKQHKKKLTGIVNGLDNAHYHPVDQKAAFKKRVLKQFDLADQKAPLFIFIGRFTWQKGVDLLLETVPEIASLKCSIIILGEGEQKYAEGFEKLATKHHNLRLVYGYDEKLSHQLYAAADFLLMPSLFEPCGLNQLIAMYYGTIPVVRGVGGLADTVKPLKNFDDKCQEGFGLVFQHPTQTALLKVVQEALKLYENPALLEKINTHNRGCDFSWEQSAQAYKKVYEALLA